MKKLILSTAVAIAVTAPAIATAQTAFQGFYAQIATGYQTTKFGSFTSQVQGVPIAIGPVYATSEQFNVSTAPAILGLGYNFALNPKWVLGVGVDYDVVTKQTNFGTTAGNASKSITGFAEMKVGNRWSLYLAPGYVATKDGLVYGKVGYAQAKATVSSYSGSGSQTLNGWLLGLGWRQQFSSALYGFLEANYMGYGKPSWTGTSSAIVPNATVTYQPSVNAYNVLVGVGVKF